MYIICGYGLPFWVFSLPINYSKREPTVGIYSLLPMIGVPFCIENFDLWTISICGLLLFSLARGGNCLFCGINIFKPLLAGEDISLMMPWDDLKTFFDIYYYSSFIIPAPFCLTRCDLFLIIILKFPGFCYKWGEKIWIGGGELLLRIPPMANVPVFIKVYEF